MEPTLKERLRLLAEHIEGNVLAEQLLESIQRDIPHIAIDGRQDSRSLWEDPQKAFITSQRLPQVTIEYRNVRYTLEGPIVVKMDLQS